MADKPEVIPQMEAKQGIKLNVVRWVLLVSLVLTAIGFVIAYAVTPEEGVEGSARSYQKAGPDQGSDRPSGLEPGGGPAQGDDKAGVN